jgi:ATP-dependent DNA helicase DinG
LKFQLNRIGDGGAVSSALSTQTRKALEAAVAAIGGQTREGQIEMAEAVANALSDQHH